MYAHVSTLDHLAVVITVGTDAEVHLAPISILGEHVVESCVCWRMCVCVCVKEGRESADVCVFMCLCERVCVHCDNVCRVLI